MTVWNRSKDKCKPLEEMGAKVGLVLLSFNMAVCSLILEYGNASNRLVTADRLITALYK